MLIILEGTDGAGKSTLAQQIGDALTDANPADRVEYWHAGPPLPGQSPIDLYERPLWNYRPGTGHHIIADRWHVGEWVYPSFLGRNTQADLASWRHIDLFLQSRGAVLVHASPPLDQIMANIERRGDDLIPLNQIAGIHAAYQSMMRASNLPKIRYAALGNPFIASEIIRLGRYMETHVQPLRPFVTYVGHHKPKYLLLGDVRHTLRGMDFHNMIPEITRTLGPAFGPHRNTSGHFLLDNLPYDVIRPPVPNTDAHGGIGLANACDVDDAAELWETLGKPRTLTLGQNANRCATWAHGTVEHPAYVRRFKNSEGSAYGLRIADALGVHTL